MDEQEYGIYDPDKYTSSGEARTFVREALDAGYDVEHYHGYAFREGPAVRIGDERQLVDLIRQTTGQVQWDTLGMGYIVYVQGTLVEDE